MTGKPDDFRRAREAATTHVQIELTAPSAMVEDGQFGGTLFRIFSDRTGTLKLDEPILVALPDADALADWTPLTLPGADAWDRARVAEVYLDRVDNDWRIVKGQLTVLRSGTAVPVNPAAAGGFGVTEGPGLRASASTIASPEASAATLAQANSDATSAAMPRYKQRGRNELKRMWVEAGIGKRLFMMLCVLTLPLLLLAALFGFFSSKPRVGVWPNGIDPRLTQELDTPVPPTPDGFGNASAAGIDTSVVPAKSSGWQRIAFVSQPNAQSIEFKDDSNATLGAVVCDEYEKTEKMRVWMQVAPRAADGVVNDGAKHDMSGIRKLTLVLDGYVYRPQNLEMRTDADGLTVLSGLIEPDESLLTRLKTVGQIELETDDRMLIAKASGHGEELTQVVGQCVALGTPF